MDIVLGSIGPWALLGGLLFPALLISSGIYLFLLTRGKIPQRQDNAEKFEAWKKEHPVAAKWSWLGLVIGGGTMLVNFVVQLVFAADYAVIP